MNAMGFPKFFCVFCPQTAVASHSQRCNMNPLPCVSYSFRPRFLRRSKAWFPPAACRFFCFIKIYRPILPTFFLSFPRS